MPPRGHVRQRPNGSWVCVIPLAKGPDGKRRAKWLSAATEKEAHQLKRRALAELAAGRLDTGSRQRLDDYLRGWLEEYVIPRRAPRTVLIYTDTIERYIAPLLGAVPLGKLTAGQLENYYAQLGKRLSPNTIRMHHSLLRTALRRAVRDKLIPESPADRADPPPPTRSKAKALPTTELLRLLSAVEASWLKVPVLLAVFAGLRKGEVLALRWQDTDLGAGTLQIRHSLGAGGLGPTKSDAGQRHLALPLFVVAALLKEKGRQAERQLTAGRLWRGEDRVICHDDGAPYTLGALSEGWRRFCKAAGFTGTRFHDLRHTASMLALRSGAPLKAVSGRLGHAGLSSTEVYLHWLSEDDNAIAGWLETRFGENNR